MPFLPPNQQRQSTEGVLSPYVLKKLEFIKSGFSTYDCCRQVSGVDRLLLPPSSGGGLAGDVGLVRLARSLTVGSAVRPVCLHSAGAVHARPASAGYGPCVVAGWAPSRAASSCEHRYYCKSKSK